MSVRRAPDLEGIPGSPGPASRQSSHSGTKARAALYGGMQWIEALINISVLAGFIGVANLGRKNLGQEQRR
jgi:hypothetical protein